MPQCRNKQYKFWSQVLIVIGLPAYPIYKNYNSANLISHYLLATVITYLIIKSWSSSERYNNNATIYGIWDSTRTERVYGCCAVDEFLITQQMEKWRRLKMRICQLIERLHNNVHEQCLSAVKYSFSTYLICHIICHVY